MTHEEAHELARAAINEQEPERDIVTRGELLAWLDAAADALRLHRLGHHDRELLEFVQGERDELKRRVAELAGPHCNCEAIRSAMGESKPEHKVAGHEPDCVATNGLPAAAFGMRPRLR